MRDGEVVLRRSLLRRALRHRTEHCGCLFVLSRAQRCDARRELGRAVRLFGRPYEPQARAGGLLFGLFFVQKVLRVLRRLPHAAALQPQKPVIILFQRPVPEMKKAVVQPLVRLRALVLLAHVEKAEPTVRREVVQLEVVVRIRQRDELVRACAVQLHDLIRKTQPREIVALVELLIRKLRQPLFTQVEGYRLLLHSSPSAAQRACAARPLP